MKIQLGIVLRVVFVFSALAPSADADTIYSVTNSSPASPEPLCLGGDCFSQTLMASWVSDVAFDAVSIFGEVGGDDSSASLTAYLTTQVGAGTTTANQVASVTLTPSALDSPGTLLFSGLNLGPGTYYLVLSGPVVETTFSYWYEYSTATVSTASGVSAGNFGMANTADALSEPDSSYAPASVFDAINAPLLSIQVTGTPTVTTAQEPAASSQLVIGLGLLVGGALQRRNTAPVQS